MIFLKRTSKALYRLSGCVDWPRPFFSHMPWRHIFTHTSFLIKRVWIQSENRVSLTTVLYLNKKCSDYREKNDHKWSFFYIIYAFFCLDTMLFRSTFKLSYKEVPEFIYIYIYIYIYISVCFRKDLDISIFCALKQKKKNIISRACVILRIDDNLFSSKVYRWTNIHHLQERYNISEVKKMEWYIRLQYCHKIGLSHSCNKFVH